MARGSGVGREGAGHVHAAQEAPAEADQPQEVSADTQACAECALLGADMCDSMKRKEKNPRVMFLVFVPLIYTLVPKLKAANLWMIKTKLYVDLIL